MMSLSRTSLVAFGLLAILVASFAMPMHRASFARPMHPGQGLALGRTFNHKGRQGEKAATYIIVGKESREHVSKRATMGICESFLYSCMSSQEAMNEISSEMEMVPVVKNYTSVGIGFVAEINEAAANMLKYLEDVDFIEKDQEIAGAASLQPIAMGYQTDRIDQRHLPLDGQYNPPFTGKGVDIYIADSGISYSHKVFEGRAQFGGYDHYGNDGKDCNGHGTHVAALAGGSITGAATQANLYSIKVLNCNRAGTYSGLIAGINHVVERAQQSGRSSVLSMSISGPVSSSVNRALQKAHEAGIISVAAAGNSKKDACEYSPASSKHVITVGGTQKKGDRLYWFSRGSGTNWGKCVDILAPGQKILSASHESDNHLVSKSGTSMATPIVSGVVAMMLEEDPSLSPDEVKEKLLSRGTKDVLDFSVLSQRAKAETPNLLVYGGPLDGKPEPSSSSSMPQPTSTQSSTSKSSTELPSSTTSSSSPSPSPSPSSSLSPSPSPSPKPELEPTPKALPEKSSQMSVNLKVSDAHIDMDTKMKTGYVPTNLNTYKHNSNWQITVVYSYVGVEAVKDYVILQEKQKDVESLLEGSLKDFAPITVAPYEEDGEIFVFLVLQPSIKERILSMEKSKVGFEVEKAEMLSQGYSPIVIRHRQVEDGESPLYIIYEKSTRVFSVTGVPLADLISLVYTEWQQGNFLTDLTYDVNDLGQVITTAIFDEGPFIPKLLFADLKYDASSLLSTNQVLRGAGYHVVALTPLIDTSFSQPAFLAIYWR